MDTEGNNSPGVITPGCLYTVNEAKDRLRAGNVTWDRLCDRGLTVRKIGSKGFVLGDDIIAAIVDECSDEDETPPKEARENPTKAMRNAMRQVLIFTDRLLACADVLHNERDRLNALIEKARG
jgi:hypothetical protein